MNVVVTDPPVPPGTSSLSALVPPPPLPAGRPPAPPAPPGNGGSNPLLRSPPPPPPPAATTSTAARAGRVAQSEAARVSEPAVTPEAPPPPPPSDPAGPESPRRPPQPRPQPPSEPPLRPTHTVSASPGSTPTVASTRLDMPPAPTFEFGWPPGPPIAITDSWCTPAGTWNGCGWPVKPNDHDPVVAAPAGAAINGRTNPTPVTGTARPSVRPSASSGRTTIGRRRRFTAPQTTRQAIVLPLRQSLIAVSKKGRGGRRVHRCPSEPKSPPERSGPGAEADGSAPFHQAQEPSLATPPSLPSCRTSLRMTG